MSTFVLLGRNGDILGLLPMLYADSLKGIRHKLLVAAEFAGLLEGVSYVERIIFDGPHYDIAGACLWAKSSMENVQCLQIKGPKEQVAEWTWKPAGITANQTPSFEQEPWRAAGRLNEWGKHPLVFDKRNPEREAALLAKVLPPKRGLKKPLMLVSSGGISSPFPYKELLHELLALKFGKQYQILDLSAVVATRLYDLLSLYERASILVATDSAPLHLARAVPNLPVVALTNDKPSLWFGTAWSPNHLWYCRYSDFPQRATEMLSAIKAIGEIRYSLPKVVHVWSEYENRSKNGSSLRWFPLPVGIGTCGRDSGNTIQDPKRFPYVKDVVRMGLSVADSEFVVLHRPDTRFEDFSPAIFIDHECSYAYRIESGIFKPVVDCFCAKKSWWKMAFKEIPDLILSNDFFWSHALWAIFKKHGAVDVTGCVYREAKT